MKARYIWTNHALKRLDERKIPRKLVDQAVSNPDRRINQGKNTIELQKTSNFKTVAAIVKKNERGENIIISVWINPPIKGTKDYRKKQRYLQKRHASLLKKLWLFILDRIDS